MLNEARELRTVRSFLTIILTMMIIATHAQETTTTGESDSSVPDAEQQEPATEGDDASEEIDAESGSLDDAIGSIEAGRDTFGQNFKGDLRVAYTNTDEDSRDGSNQSESEWRGRFRAGGTFSLTERLVIGGRIASICSTTECNPDLVFDSTLPNSSSIDDGDITLDQLYIHGFRREKFDVAIGRLQTKFVSRAGVFAKSLDRNDSSGTNVNWTDGVHGVLRVNKEWTGHFILQLNQADGTGNIRRGPIDFNDDDARITYFLAWENMQRFGPINQQGFDITYMPASLMKDGDRNGRLEDYVGVVGRFAASWPEGSLGRRLNVAGEIGYAPETPTRAAMGLPGNGDTDGLAWLVSVSAVDFRPNHSVGINYGRTDAGWLLSPQYRENEEVTEIRYMWRRSADLAIDLRARWRAELEQQESTVRKREELNVFVRFTLGFGH
jgi:hypothetical protein